MDFVNETVKVTIENVTGNTFTTDLNTIMIMGKHQVLKAPEQFRMYTSASEASDAGFVKTEYVYKSIALAFSQNPRPFQVMVCRGMEELATVDDYITEMERSLMYSQGWLWVVNDLRVAADQLKFAKAVQTTERFYCAGSSDPEALLQASKKDIGSMVLENSLSQTFCFYSDADTELSTFSADEIAILGRCAGKVAGTINFKNKKLTSVTVPTTIQTTTDQRTLTAKGYTFAAYGGGEVRTYGAGKFGDGNWIDIGLSMTWIKVNVRQDLFNLQGSEDKINMENDGIATYESRVRSVLVRGQNLGIIAKDSPISVSTPTSASLTNAQRHSRNLPDVKFRCRLSGAIDSVDVLGEVYE